MRFVLWFLSGGLVGLVAGAYLKYGAMLVAAITSLEATIKASIQRIESAIQRVETAIKTAKGVLMLLLALTLFAPLLYAQLPAAGKDSHIKSTWNVPNTTYPNCSSTVTNSCLIGYTETFTPPTGVGGTAPTASIGTASTNGVVSYTWGPGGNLYCGTWTIAVVADYVDGTGTAVASSPISTTVVEPCPFVASPASGLAGTPTP